VERLREVLLIAEVVSCVKNHLKYNLMGCFNPFGCNIRNLV